MKIGMVGCGDISRAHGAAARNIPGLRFTACCDIREQAATAWAAEFECESVYADCGEMVKREDLDGVVLATWPTQHCEHIEQCLAAGARNILCEKALTLTGREALGLWKRVTETGAMLMEGFMYRHHPALRRAKSLVASGEVGQVDSVRACFSAHDPESAAVTDASRN